MVRSRKVKRKASRKVSRKRRSTKRCPSGCVKASRKLVKHKIKRSRRRVSRKKSRKRKSRKRKSAKKKSTKRKLSRKRRRKKKYYGFKMNRFEVLSKTWGKRPRNKEELDDAYARKYGVRVSPRGTLIFGGFGGKLDYKVTKGFKHWHGDDRYYFKPEGESDYLWAPALGYRNKKWLDRMKEIRRKNEQQLSPKQLKKKAYRKKAEKEKKEKRRLQKFPFDMKKK